MRHDLIADTWHFQVINGSSSLIIPDGCRDFIFSQTIGMKPRWSVSPLFDQTTLVEHSAQTTLYGYRCKPGTRINEAAFYTAIKDMSVSLAEYYLDDFLYLDPRVEEALACLSSPMGSINRGAAELGVSLRTLQRLLVNETGRSPSYWLLLARARKAAKAIIESASIGDVSYHYGYFDQSHLCREIRRWFGCSPKELTTMNDIHQQLQDSGYC